MKWIQKKYNTSNYGDNCSKWIVEMAKNRVLTINLRHIMLFDFKFLFCSAMIFCLASCGAVGITTNSINVKDVDISDIENDYKYQEIIYPQFEFSGNKEIKKRIDEINFMMIIWMM